MPLKVYSFGAGESGVFTARDSVYDPHSPLPVSPSSTDSTVSSPALGAVITPTALLTPLNDEFNELAIASATTPPAAARTAVAAAPVPSAPALPAVHAPAPAPAPTTASVSVDKVRATAQSLLTPKKVVAAAADDQSYPPLASVTSPSAACLLTPTNAANAAQSRVNLNVLDAAALGFGLIDSANANNSSLPPLPTFPLADELAIDAASTLQFETPTSQVSGSSLYAAAQPQSIAAVTLAAALAASSTPVPVSISALAPASAPTAATAATAASGPLSAQLQRYYALQHEMQHVHAQMTAQLQYHQQQQQQQLHTAQQHVAAAISNVVNQNRVKIETASPPQLMRAIAKPKRAIKPTPKMAAAAAAAKRIGSNKPLSPATSMSDADSVISSSSGSSRNSDASSAYHDSEASAGEEDDVDADASDSDDSTRRITKHHNQPNRTAATSVPIAGAAARRTCAYSAKDAGNSRSSTPASVGRTTPIPSAVSSAALDPTDPMNQIAVGIYTRGERSRKIARYREKRSRRNFEKKVSYGCRKNFADNRPRVGGRFISVPAGLFNGKPNNGRDSSNASTPVASASPSPLDVPYFGAISNLSDNTATNNSTVKEAVTITPPLKKRRVCTANNNNTAEVAFAAPSHLLVHSLVTANNDKSSVLNSSQFVVSLPERSATVTAATAAAAAAENDFSCVLNGGGSVYGSYPYSVSSSSALLSSFGPAAAAAAAAAAGTGSFTSSLFGLAPSEYSES